MKKQSKNKKFSVVDLVMWVVFAVLLLYSLSVLFIFIWGFVTSLKSVADFTVLGNVLNLPDSKYSKKEMMGHNYRLVILGLQFKVNPKEYVSIFGTVSKEGFYTNVFSLTVNTIFYAFIGSFVDVATSLVVAYIVAKYRYKFCKFLNALVIVLLGIPIVGNYPAQIKLLRDLGLYNTHLGIIITSITFTGTYFLILVGFFEGIPDSYAEAAEIDGASQFSIFIKIFVPLAGKIFGTIMLLTFITRWNNYQVPLMYFPSLPTLAYAIFNASTATFNPNKELKGMWDTPQKIAACMTLALPLIILFMILNKKIMGDISLGGLKE